VFAIPGSIHSTQSRGCHALIKQGAKLVESAQDVMEELGAYRPPATPMRPESAPETQAALPHMHRVLLNALGFEPCSLDTLQARTGMDTANLQAELMALELQGWLVRIPGGAFQRQVQG